jgi:hypothetical protein
MAKVTKKAQNGDRVTADKKGLYTRLSKYKTNDGDRFYKSTSGDIASTKDMNDFKSRTKSADSVRAADLTPAEIKHYETARRYKAGGKIIKKAQNGNILKSIGEAAGKAIGKAVNPPAKDTSRKSVKGAKVATKKYKSGGTVSMQLGSYTRQIGKNYTGKAKMGKSMGKCKYGC